MALNDISFFRKLKKKYENENKKSKRQNDQNNNKLFKINIFKFFKKIKIKINFF